MSSDRPATKIKIPRTVWVLGFVSLLMDISSEMIHALLVDGQEEEFEKIYQLNREIGLPVSLKEIEITEEEWKESMGHIPKMSDVEHYRSEEHTSELQSH